MKQAGAGVVSSSSFRKLVLVKVRTFCKKSFLIGGQEVREINTFPVCKTSFGLIDKS